MSTQTFNNNGVFPGAAIFQGSKINNARIMAGSMSGSDGSRQELQKLLTRLGEALTPVPPEKVDDAEATASAAEDLVKEAAKEQPNKSRLRVLGDGLIAAAKLVGAAAPAALSITEKIVVMTGKVHGLG